MLLQGIVHLLGTDVLKGAKCINTDSPPQFLAICVLHDTDPCQLHLEGGSIEKFPLYQLWLHSKYHLECRISIPILSYSNCHFPLALFLHSKVQLSQAKLCSSQSASLKYKPPSSHKHSRNKLCCQPLLYFSHVFLLQKRSPSQENSFLPHKRTIIILPNGILKHVKKQVLFKSL